MDKFKQNEIRGRTLFSEWCNQRNYISNLEYSQGKYDVYDAQMKVNGKRVIVEIKVRDIKYINYNTHMLESSKLTGLKSISQEGDKIYYCNFFGENDLYVYNITDVDNNYSYKYLDKTTAVDKGKTDKKIVELDSSTAMKFRKVNNQWVKV